MPTPITLDVSLLSDIEPWVPTPDWRYAAGELKVLDGALMLATGTTGVLVAATPPLTGPLTVSAVMIAGATGKPGIAFVNEDGDGYIAEFASDVIQIYEMLAGIKGPDHSWNYGIDRALGDVITAEYIRDEVTPDSDVLNVYLNGNPTPITTASGLTYIDGMSPGVCTSAGPNGFSSITVDAGAATSIDTLAATLYPGVPAAFETTGVGASGPEVTSITFGGVSCNFSQTLGDGALTPPAWVSGLVQPLNHGTLYPVVISDSETSASANRLYGVPAGFAHRTIPGTISTAEDSLYKHELLVPGCDVYIPDLGGGTVEENGTLREVPFGTYVGWLRDFDDVMHEFDIVVIEEDAPPSGGGDWTGLLVAGRMKAFRMVVSSN